MKICLKCRSVISNNSWVCQTCSWQALNVNGFTTFAPLLATSEEKFFNKEAFANLYEIENDNFWFRARNKLIAWAIKKYFSNAKTFLELGCGTGYVSTHVQKHFPNLNISVADIFHQSLPFVQQRIGKQCNIYQMDGREIPFIDEFDLIGAFDVLEHIKEDEKVLIQIYNALRKNGGAIFTVPQHPALWSATDVAAHHVRRYKMQELQTKLLTNGFKILLSTSFVFSLLPLLFISRILQKKSTANSKEFNINKRTDSLLEKILALETAFIKTGIHPPIGGTRFIVAQKT